jgi:hypothetical protein
MFKKTFTYTDFNNEERTEDFYFNLSASEITEMELGLDGGMSGIIKGIIATEDVSGIAQLFKKIILLSYGERSLDGKHFFKVDPEGHPLSRNLISSPVFDQLFLGLFKDALSVADFIKGVMPPEVVAEVEAKMAAEKDEPEGKPMAVVQEVVPVATP